MNEYHCGMCELSWLAVSTPACCPHCEADEIETKLAAISHNALQWEWFDPEYDQTERPGRAI